MGFFGISLGLLHPTYKGLFHFIYIWNLGLSLYLRQILGAPSSSPVHKEKTTTSQQLLSSMDANSGGGSAIQW